MSSGSNKKKKSKNKPAAGFPILPVLIGVLIVGTLLGVGYFVLGQRKTVSGYDTSVTQVTNALRTRDPESVQGALKLSEIEALVTGNPTVTRETKDGAEYAVYTWPSTLKPIGFRLKLEKNGATDEVAELITLGAP